MQIKLTCNNVTKSLRAQHRDRTTVKGAESLIQDRQTGRQHNLVISEIVAQHEIVDDWKHMLIVEEIYTLDTARTVTDVTIQLLNTHIHTYRCHHPTVEHTHTYTDTYVRLEKNTILHFILFIDHITTVITSKVLHDGAQ